MPTIHIDGESFRIPGGLNDFQEKLYVHLIRWKRGHITSEPGMYGGRVYDTMLPESMVEELHPLHPAVRERFLQHQRDFPFKSHKFLGNHMASSQAACANLFLPLMENPEACARVLRSVKQDLASIAVEHLDRGFRIEFWDEPDNMLNDHNQAAGTDSDFAIAYTNHEGRLCLWLIEHKLSEAEFTTCGGARSRGRTEAHACAPASAVMEDPDLCYYHFPRGYRYWELTLGIAAEYFRLDRIRDSDVCPFIGGLNQLWRNQLLAAAIEKADRSRWPYEKVYFSVVHHPGNSALLPSIDAFRALLARPDRFSVFTPDVLVREAGQAGVPALEDWAAWYRGLYFPEEGTKK